MISNRISDDTPPQMKILKYGYSHPNALLQTSLKLEHCKLHKGACLKWNVTQLMRSNYLQQYILWYTVTNSLTSLIASHFISLRVYHMINCPIFLTLSNQMSLYKSKCIRIGPCYFESAREKTDCCPPLQIHCQIGQENIIKTFTEAQLAFSSPRTAKPTIWHKKI